MSPFEEKLQSLPPELKQEVSDFVDFLLARRSSDKNGKDSLEGMIGTGRGCFATPQDADAFVREERESWGHKASRMLRS